MNVISPVGMLPGCGSTGHAAPDAAGGIRGADSGIFAMQRPALEGGAAGGGEVVGELGVAFVVSGSGLAVVDGAGSGGVRLHAGAQNNAQKSPLPTRRRIARALSHAPLSAVGQKSGTASGLGGGKPQRGAGRLLCEQRAVS
jgi:hypothetical protein